MNRIWKISTSLVLAALFAHQAAGQGYGPRNWKSYLPGSPTSAMKLPADEAEATIEPVSSTEEADEATTESSSQAVTEFSSRKSAANKVPVVDPASKQANNAKPPVGETTIGKFASYYAQNETPPPAPGLLRDGPPMPPTDDSNSASTFQDEPVPTPLSSGMGAGCTSCQPACNACNSCDLNSGCGNVCENCPTRNFAKIEYLMWWGRGRSTPPLVTTSFNGTPMADAGVLGLPTTTVLYGGNDIGTDWRSGGRLSIGRVLDQDGMWMAVGRFYGLDDSTDSFHAESAAGDPILARPFFNVLLNQQDALLVGFPGVSTNGVIDVQSKSDMMGADAYVRHLLLGEEDLTIDFLGGYQFSRLDDSLEIRNSELILVDPQGIFAPNTTIAMRDTFRTRNEFHGGVIGLAADVMRGPWKFEALGKVGFGNQHQTVVISGNTQITPGVGPVTNDPQGLLARQTNSGTYTRDAFTIIPEANFTLGYQINSWTFSAGYSFMYWKDVAWAGDQIDTRVNLSNPLVGDPLPEFRFRNTDYWLQGLSFGAEYTF